jgi:uncharacterized protein (DUF488 family)
MPWRGTPKVAIAERAECATTTSVNRKRKLFLFTAGYEGLSVEEFLEKLKASSVKVLYDIRFRPQSRKPGFSKNALSAGCERLGIRYLHDSKLGTPPDQMKDMKAAGEYTPEIFARYRAFLLEQGESLERAVEVARTDATCLVCYEADYRTCHRKVVAEEIERRAGLPVLHLWLENSTNEA